MIAIKIALTFTLLAAVARSEDVCKNTCHLVCNSIGGFCANILPDDSRCQSKTVLCETSCDNVCDCVGQCPTTCRGHFDTCHERNPDPIGNIFCNFEYQLCNQDCPTACLGAQLTRNVNIFIGELQDGQ